MLEGDVYELRHELRLRRDIAWKRFLEARTAEEQTEAMVELYVRERQLWAMALHFGGSLEKK